LDRVRGNKKSAEILALQAGDRSPRVVLNSADEDGHVPEKSVRGTKDLARFDSLDSEFGAETPAVGNQRETAPSLAGQLQVESPTVGISSPAAVDVPADPFRKTAFPATQEANGTRFMGEALELRRQLLDVHCAVDTIRDVSLALSMVCFL
jgi:hypothetical protein